MKAARYRNHGIPNEVIELINSMTRPLAAGEIRCAVLAAPINPSDLLTLRGEHALLMPLPAIGGNEGVGRVVEVSKDVKTITEGQWVQLPFGIGTWQSEVIASAGNVTVLPCDVDPLQLSMLSINPPTALLMLETITSLSPGAWIVQNGANSSVGECIIQLAKHLGFNTCNIVRRKEICEVLEAKGANVVLVEGVNLSERIREATGNSAQLGIDALGGVATQQIASGLGDGGVVVSYGHISGEPCRVSQNDIIFRNIRLEGFWLAAWARKASHVQRTEVYARLADFVRSGRLQIRVDKTYPLEDIRTAITHAMQSGRNGKIIVTPN